MAEVLTLSALTAVEKRQIRGLKRPIEGIGADLAKVKEKAKDLAPRVVQAFNQLAAKYDGMDGRLNLGGVVGFVRLFNPELPKKARGTDNEPGYQNDPVYNAVMYMRRIVSTRRQPGQDGQVGRGTSPQASALARLVATMIAIAKDPAPIWRAVAEALGTREDSRTIKVLQGRVKDAQPLIDLSERMKPIALTDDDIIHVPIAGAVETTVQGSTVERHPLAQRGRAVRGTEQRRAA
jgi:hypothetical protein